MAVFTVSLHNLRFFAAHGVFEEERRVGNEFEVNLTMKLKAPKEKVTALEQTVNYADVFRIVSEIFLHRQSLLETIATDIADAVKEAYPAVRKIAVQITKLHPPITSFSGSVSVTFQKRFP